MKAKEKKKKHLAVVISYNQGQDQMHNNVLWTSSEYLHGTKRKLMHKSPTRTAPLLGPGGPSFWDEVWGKLLHFSLQSSMKHEISHPHPADVLFCLAKLSAKILLIPLMKVDLNYDEAYRM